MSKLATAIEKILADADATGRHKVAAAAMRLRENPDSLDARVNLLGAMHEVRMLRNSLRPAWDLLRTDEAAWSDRCVARLATHDNDFDYWAVAELLGCNAHRAIAALLAAGFSAWSLRHSRPFSGEMIHIACFSPPPPKTAPAFRAPVIEIGWDTCGNELVDVSRSRCTQFTSQGASHGSVVGKGYAANVLRATLPHGSWRLVNDAFELHAAHVVPMGASILAS